MDKIYLVIGVWLFIVVCSYMEWFFDTPSDLELSEQSKKVQRWDAKDQSELVNYHE